MEKIIYCKYCGSDDVHIKKNGDGVENYYACYKCNKLWDKDQPLERIPELIDIMGGDDSRLVCKYCGGANVKVGGDGTTHYYYCISCDRATDLIEVRDYNTKSQSGEREEKIVKEKLRRELPIGAYTDLYEEVTDNKEERILGYVTCGERVLDDYARIVAVMLSESKKEGYQNGCKDMLEDTKAKMVIFIESESGKSGRKEIIKFIKSLK